MQSEKGWKKEQKQKEVKINCIPLRIKIYKF